MALMRPVFSIGGSALFLSLWMTQGSGAFLSEATKTSDYVGSSTCARCHVDLARSYAATPMARSSGRLRGGELQEFLERGEFLHARSGVRYRLVKENAQYFMEFSRQASGGAPSIQGRRELAYFVGSGAAAQGYLFEIDNFLYQAPVSYYARRRRWDIAPGYETDSHLDLMRAVQRNCLECHASGVQAVDGTQNQYRQVAFLEGGVSCERCHGAGRYHVEEMRSGNRPSARTIVNPGRLDPVRRDSACAICHLTGDISVARPRRSLATFQVGDQLTDHSVPFVFSKARQGVKVIGHFEKLWQSRCKVGSGDRLWCGTCHDPHRLPAESEQVAYFRAKCEQCHQSAGCREPLAVRQKQGNDCVVCHMPKTEATDGGHSAFTDHSLPRARRRASPTEQAPGRVLVPFWKETGEGRELGIAYAKLAAQERRPELVLQALRLLDREIGMSSQDAEVWLQYGYLHDLRGDKNRALEGYRLSNSLDPALVEAAVNLGAKLAEKGHHAEAIGLWKKALEQNGGLETVRINLAIAYLRTGDYSLARTLLHKALDDNPDLLPARRLLDNQRLKDFGRPEPKSSAQ